MKSKDVCAFPDLITVDQAIDKILSSVKAVDETETVDILDALNRVLHEDVHSSINVPGYDNSAMDGYAVRSDDCKTAGSQLVVSQRIAAGQVGVELVAGTAARIFTGAPIPDGADAVVMQELCERKGEVVTVNSVVDANSNVRCAGEDIAKDSVVLKLGTRLRPQELGLLASVGMSKLNVKRKLKVAIFFTGDELVSPGEPLNSGRIYNSNRYTLHGLLKKMDCDIIDLGIVPDTLDATIDVLKKAAAEADLVITSGGVSVGEEDYVRIALEQLGELNMWRIAMKPGKPVAFGKVGNTLFMGLPGNPVSVFVTFLIFARGLILKMQGLTHYHPKSLFVTADFNWGNVQRQEYLRVKLINNNQSVFAQLYAHQGSGVLSSASWADGVVEVEIGSEIKPGDSVRYFPFEGLY